MASANGVSGDFDGAGEDVVLNDGERIMTTPKFYGHTPLGLGEIHMPGRLIVIEGTDGVGRSTQIAILKEWLETQGHAVLDTGFRRSELTGDGIDRAMRGHTLDHVTLNLFYATDFWDRMERSIMPALEAGMVILGDRYIFSIMARSRVRGVPAQWLDDVLEFAMVPDQVYFLDVDVEHLLPRVMANRELDHWESGHDFLREPDRYASFVRYQGALIQEFRNLDKQYGFETIDARRSVLEVFEDLQTGIKTVLEGMKSQ
jgi:dTMP kinase